MVQAHLQPKQLLLQLPTKLALQVTPEQFAVLAAANRDLRLERTATGELIVNPPTGGETGKRNGNRGQSCGEAFEQHMCFLSGLAQVWMSSGRVDRQNCRQVVHNHLGQLTMSGNNASLLSDNRVNDALCRAGDIE